MGNSASSEEAQISARAGSSSRAPDAKRMTIDTSGPTDAMADSRTSPQSIPNGVTNGTGVSSGDEDRPCAVESSSPLKKKRDKSKIKKVTFSVDVNEVEVIPYDDSYTDENDPNGINVSDNGVCEDSDIQDNDLEFIKKFANLKKLESVIQANSQRHQEAEKVRLEADVRRARAILQKQAQWQQLERLIPGEQLETVLSMVNMQHQMVVQREDKKYMTSSRGKTSFIYLAGPSAQAKSGPEAGAEGAEAGPTVRVAEETRAAAPFSQTFNGGGLL